MKLESILSRDLTAYLAFRALEIFHEEYEISDQQLLQSPYLTSIFHFFLKSFIQDELKAHDLDLEEEVFLDFSRNASALVEGYKIGKNEEDLSLYFDYISDWTKAGHNWQSEKPMEFGRFEFV